MNYDIILRHKIYQQTGAWPLGQDVAGYSLSDSDTGICLNWFRTDMEKPDLSTFTEQDELDAAAAWATYQQTSKSAARKTLENKFITQCDAISGQTHQVLLPLAALNKYVSEIAAGHATAATQMAVKYILAMLAFMAPADVSWHDDV